MPFPNLALGAGEGIFLPRFRVKKDGEIPSHGAIALCLEGFWRTAQDNPIPLPNRSTQERIAHGSPHLEDSHGQGSSR
jgi:hypothetical protein